MKKRILFSVLALAAISTPFNSCNKIANQLAQSIGWTGVDITIDVPVTSDTGYHSSLGMGTFTYDLDSMIKSKTSNQLGMKNIDELKFTSCTLTILNPDANNNFQNFKMAQASFYTNANSTVANLGQIDNNPDTYAASINLPINNTTNIKSYVPNSGPVTFFYRAAGNLRKGTDKVLQVNVHVEYNIHVTL